MKRKLKIVIIVGLVTIMSGLILRDKITPFFFTPTKSVVPIASDIGNNSLYAQMVSNSLEVPWGVAVLPSQELLVTERMGRIKRINLSGQILADTSVPGIVQTAEGGLLGILLHPDFEINRQIYLYQTYQSDGQKTLNQVVRYKYDLDGRLTQRLIVINEIPGALYHDGGRMEFGPDNKIYVTTGDATEPLLAQDLGSLGGKILRLNDDGSIPSDNPIATTEGTVSPIYSLGHRNPQGLAWDSQGNLYSSEHGPSGIDSGYDEINRIVPGGNYGWPYFKGNSENQALPDRLTRQTFEFPLIESGPDEVWAPAGLSFWQGDLFFAGLRGESLYRLEIDQSDITNDNLTRYFVGEFGRLRTTFVFDDDTLVLSTSNRDGRGDAVELDDRILLITTKN